MADKTYPIKEDKETFVITLQDLVGGKEVSIQCALDTTAPELIDALKLRWNLPQGISAVLFFIDENRRQFVISHEDVIYDVIQGHSHGKIMIGYELTAG